MYNLNRLVNTGAWTLEIVHGINDRGEIAGTGTHRGRRAAFLLVPVGTTGADVQSW